MVSVTSVTGLQVSEGTADLQRQNLVVSVVEQPSSEAEGTILNQEPAAGTQVRIRSTVRLQKGDGRAGAALVLHHNVLQRKAKCRFNRDFDQAG